MWTIEQASIRQNVKHGFVVVYKRGTYESVDSWRIYRTKKLAQARIAALVSSEKWCKAGT